MTLPGTDEQIEMFGRMALALSELESCREFSLLIPEVRTNIVYAAPEAEIPAEVLAVDGRITLVSGMPQAAGRIRFGVSGHLARLVISLRKTSPSARAAIDFANPPGFLPWLRRYCQSREWILVTIDRKDEPGETRMREGASMSWKAFEAVLAAGGVVPDIICDAGGPGKEPVCVIIGKEPLGIAQDLCGIAREYADTGKGAILSGFQFS
ncbi:thiamine-phosphate synthase family protein [Methanoregula sp.]|uniref:thiamine-phosphate synthase family protein n=1 Tax=Methanoregula sp. TaxID=2052170 RepID=UPI00261787E6|nr:thiamine-phosphate synthase family protein [Methanoregula sp.]MDD5143125.1 thiamine-phosphate synthase family protein [Methanoregula sp.]